MSNFENEQTTANVNEAPVIVEEAIADSNTDIIAPPALKVIDWDEATATAGDNMDFLKELISDLLNEARTAEDEIGEAIRASNYTAIMRAAHRIGGTCSYFCCEATLDSCHKLKTAGHDGMKGPEDPAALRATFDQLFIQFVDRLNGLREQIAAKFSE